MNKVVVTGAAGFVGSALVKELLKHNIKVVAFDVVDEPKERLPLGNENLEYSKLDIGSFSLVKETLNGKDVDTFYHFAWVGSAGPLRDDYNCQVNNALVTVELMKTAKEVGCKKFVVAGSIMEFETEAAIYSQGNKPHMAYIYGTGKKLAHLICKPVANQIGIDLVWAYITNTFGVGEKSPRLINSTIRKCINHEELLFTAGTQNYDFIYIDDVARAFYLLGEKGKANKGYVIGSGNAQPLRGFLEKLVYTCDKNAKPIFGDIPFTGTNLPLDVFSIEEIKNDCGFEPQVSFEKSIELTFNWLKEEEKK